jgi:hypothetical protein
MWMENFFVVVCIFSLTFSLERYIYRSVNNEVVNQKEEDHHEAEMGS